MCGNVNVKHSPKFLLRLNSWAKLTSRSHRAAWNQPVYFNPFMSYPRHRLHKLQLELCKTRVLNLAFINWSTSGINNVVACSWLMWEANSHCTSARFSQFHNIAITTNTKAGHMLCISHECIFKNQHFAPYISNVHIN